MKLQTKYSLTILALVLGLVISLGGIQLWHYQASLKTLTTAGSEAVEQAMITELQAKETLLVKVLATALTNPVYQLDMVRIEELIKSAKADYNVRYVYVFDKDTRIIHDGTKALQLYGKPLGRVAARKALEENRLIAQSTPNELVIDSPIVIGGEELIGGLSVAFSLESLRASIATRKEALNAEFNESFNRELWAMVGAAVLFSAAGIVLSFFLGRTWSKPIHILSSLATKVGQGEYDSALPSRRTDELGQLATAFAGMVKNLKDLRETEIDQARKIQQSNAELQYTNTELLKANKAKDEFLSIMSHELKTPLNVIMGYAELARTDTLPAIGLKPEEAVNKILIHSKDLLHMVDEILQATRIEAGAARAVVEDVSLSAFLDDLRLSCDNPTTKELTLIWNYQSDLPSTRTDRDKLKHILQNLIANAIKFTPQGSVTVSARYFADQKIVELKVADTGIGIPKELLSSIFERFRQLDASNTRTYGGVGLGLFIVKRFAEMLGGTITVESEPEIGSTFTLTLPIVSLTQNYGDHQGERPSVAPEI